jgi:outer membrane receptor for ferrienterochelin and colicin
MKCFLGFVFLLILKQKTNRKHQTNKEEKSEVLHFGVLVWKWSNTRTQTNTERKKNKKRGRVQSRKTKQEEEEEEISFFSFFLAERCIENKIPFSKNGG